MYFCLFFKSFSLILTQSKFTMVFNPSGTTKLKDNRCVPHVGWPGLDELKH